jgi:membrane protease YdiL (CAAX protease family)
MNRIAAAAVSLMFAVPALADEAVVAPPPQVDADPTALILFALLMVGMIGGFAAYIWMKERKRNAK